jgi:hypothetical protein
MRHFLLLTLTLTLTVAPLAGGMGQAARAAGLVALPGLALGLAARESSAAGAAIQVAPVTAVADHHLAAAAGTVEQTGTDRHRRPGPMRAGLGPLEVGYSQGVRKHVFWGATPSDSHI